jgi:hypothetical protein
MQGPISIMDVEPVSQHNPPTEPRGQERRFGRPTLAGVNAALSANIPAGFEGSVDISAGLTITGSNNDLKIKTNPDATGFTSLTVAQGAYASGYALVAAINAALGGTAVARLSDDGLHVVLHSVAKGEGSYFALDASGLGTALGLSAGDFTVPSVGSTITDTLPVGGPLNISEAALRTKFGAGPSDAQLSAFADSIAPRLIETDAVIKSFQVGQISGFRASNYNPDPSRYPRLTSGPAIAVVQDDGVTPFSAPLTEITSAKAASGALTIIGKSLGSPEVQETVVVVMSASEGRSVKLFQKVIEIGGGSVYPTKIVLPASLLSGLGIVGSKVRVQYTSFASGLASVTP